MHRGRQICAAAIGAACSLAFTPAFADSMFLKFSGDIVGESIDPRHVGEIDIDSYSIGIEADTSWTKGGGASVGKPNPGEFHFTALLNSSVPFIMRYITTGKAANTAMLTVRSETGQGSKDGFEYLKLTFTGMFFTKFGHSGYAGPDFSRPMSDISGVYKTVKMEYTPRKKDGSPGPVICSMWDIPAGTAGPC